MKIFKKIALCLLIAPSWMVASVKGSDTPLTEVHPSSMISSLSYSERFSQSVGYLTEQLSSGAQQIGKTLYRNRVPLISTAVALSAFYLLPTANGLTKEEVLGFCPESLHFEDLFNQALRGVDGSPLVMQDGYQLIIHPEDRNVIESHYSQNQLPDFLSSTQTQWSDEVILMGGTNMGFFPDLQKTVYDCAYIIQSAVNANVMVVGFHLAAPFIQPSVLHDII